jgi:hypothetical protein
MSKDGAAKGAADRPFCALASEMAREVDMAIAPDAPDAALHALWLWIHAEVRI